MSPPSSPRPGRPRNPPAAPPGCGSPVTVQCDLLDDRVKCRGAGNLVVYLF
jgi:hypothetical protein